MESQDNSTSTSNELKHHKTDLKEAIEYLPPNYDFELLCRLLKHVYKDEGKSIARRWASEAKVGLPNDFNSFWAEINLTNFQKHTFCKYIREKLYDKAKNTGWTPKSLRHGKQTKKPPKMSLVKQEAEKITQKQELEIELAKNRERHLDKDDRSYIPRSIVNTNGGCYLHPFMKTEDVPQNKKDYLRELTKLVDCEVRVREAIEDVNKRPGRQTDEIKVRYILELNNRAGKQKIAEVNHENLTRSSRFSDFLVEKGFTNFKGTRGQFEMFHEFLINEQEYPTIKRMTSWGEYEEGLFLFLNGLYDTQKNKFYPADDDYKIKYNNQHLLCPSGSEQVTPPRLAQPKDDSNEFLRQAFLRWEDFNGPLNVRTTVGYAMATLFSRVIIQKYSGFPLLFNFGERGTGKSTSMDWFMSLFGYKGGNRQSVSKQNTKKAIIRRMTLPSYFPFFLDDYRNHETNKNAPNLTSPILNWFEHIGTGMARKSTDFRTIDTPMRAAVVMTGNDKPIDPAVLSRMIILNYTNFLDKDQQRQVRKISDHTDRLSEFTYLALENYEAIKKDLFRYIEENKNWLADQGFEGRTSLIWGIMLAGYQCLPHVLPGLTSWHSDFEGFRSQICEKIKREASLEHQQAPLYEFFEALTHFATMKSDPDDKKTKLLDHRHFRIREEEAVADHNGQVIYEGPVLAIHMSRIWNSLQGVHAAVTKDQHKSKILTMLTNSKYFLEKSQQVQLTAELNSREEKNLRCYYLSIQELEKHGRLEEVIGKAREYEQNRKDRIY